MFQAIRYRLLWSYQIVLGSILTAFAIAVRLIFAHNLASELTDKLVLLGEGAVASTEFSQGKFIISEDFSANELNFHHQAIQWFDPRGRLVNQKGSMTLALPVATQHLVHTEIIKYHLQVSTTSSVQIQSGHPRIEGITLPILDENNHSLRGYVRVSQSLEETDQNLNKLDWGLGGGIAVALLLSGMGGIWLTRQAMEPIEDNFQRLKQFTADASHELRSPLMAIKSNVSVALKYANGMRPTDSEKFKAIANATQQMTHLTEDLLLLARTDQVPDREGSVFNLTVILEQLVRVYQPRAATKKINFNFQLTDALYLVGNASQVTRLFTNLIDNALQYTPPRGTVEIEAAQSGQILVVKIRDTGIGIAPEQLERIFDRFWRSEQSRAYWDGGSGLGLAIAQAIAKSHHGLITVTSQLGVGSCFTVRLPASTPHHY